MVNDFLVALLIWVKLYSCQLLLDNENQFTYNCIPKISSFVWDTRLCQVFKRYRCKQNNKKKYNKMYGILHAVSKQQNENGQGQ